AQVLARRLNALPGQQQRRLAADDGRKLVVAQQARRKLQRLAVRGCQREGQPSGFGIDQRDVDRLGLRQTRKLRVQHVQQSIQARRRRQRRRQVVDDVQFLDRAARLGLQARVLNRDRGLAGERPRQTQFFGLKQPLRVDRLDL